MRSCIVYTSVLVIVLLFTLRVETSESEPKYNLDLTETGPNFMIDFETALLKLIEENHIKEAKTFNISCNVFFPVGTKVSSIKNIVDFSIRTFKEHLPEFQVYATNKINISHNELKGITFDMFLEKEDDSKNMLKIRIQSLDEDQIENELNKHEIIDRGKLLKYGSIEMVIIFETPIDITFEFSRKIGQLMLKYIKNRLENPTSINVISTQNCLESNRNVGETDIFFEIIKNVVEFEHGSFLDKESNRKERIIDDITTFVEKLNISHNSDQMLMEQDVIVTFYTDYQNEYQFSNDLVRINEILRNFFHELEPNLPRIRIVPEFRTSGEISVTLCYPGFNNSYIFHLSEKFPLISNHTVDLFKGIDTEEAVEEILAYKTYTAKSVPNGGKLELSLPFKIEDETLATAVRKNLKLYNLKLEHEDNYVDEEGNLNMVVYISLKYDEKLLG